MHIHLYTLNHLWVTYDIQYNVNARKEVVILYSLENNDKKRCLYMFSMMQLLFKNIFNPRLVEFVDVGLMDKEDQLYTCAWSPLL